MSQKELKVINKEEVGGDAVRVCATYRVLPDNMEGECDQCHRPIFFDPHPPFLCRKLCLVCAKPLLTKPDAEIAGTPEVALLMSLCGVSVEDLRAASLKYEPPHEPER